MFHLLPLGADVGAERTQAGSSSSVRDSGGECALPNAVASIRRDQQVGRDFGTLTDGDKARELGSARRAVRHSGIAGGFTPEAAAFVPRSGPITSIGLERQRRDRRRCRERSLSSDAAFRPRAAPLGGLAQWR